MEHNKAKIMVVDDSKLERKLMAAYLMPHGYEVIEVQNGNAALATVKTTPPDLIVLDLILEGMSGLEICRELKQSEDTRLIPIVMVTAYGDKQSRVAGLEAGADDFLIKPVDRGELVARVKSLLKVKAYYEYARLKDYYQNLEDAVKEKTAQLESALNKLQETNLSLTQAYLDTLYRLSVAAEYRDEDTAGHIKRISHYSAVIAAKLGVSPELTEMIFRASPLHDVGKIGIPDHVLLKAGKLSAAEWEIMRRHTVIGAKILGGSNNRLLQVAEQIAISHHEKFDGSGYPFGLAGQKIPLVGRIVALADVFDALTNKRVYKPIYSNEEALRIIRQSSGNHFDPEVVEAFFKATDEIFEIQANFRDDKTGVLSYPDPVNKVSGMLQAGAWYLGGYTKEK